jgi:hypothetical protein
MPPFVGTWFLVAHYTRLADGTTVRNWGENAVGILMYDTHGNMAVQLMRTDERARDYRDLSDPRTAYEGFHAYFGRYEVDEVEQVVRHYVRGAGYFGYRGSVQAREYELDGDTLTLRVVSPAEKVTRVLVWRRAEGTTA